jgi:hypothetical protein
MDREQMARTGLVKHVQFDDLETYIHSRLKPASVVAAVEEKTRKILGVECASMPAKGRLARKALEKYGPRPDERPEAWESLMKTLQLIVSPDANIHSDSNPRYPKFVKQAFPHAKHYQELSRRACIAGYGELKEGARDPLFWINHTFAMMRANMSRLLRRTWCTTKKIENLKHHLEIYVHYHNHVILRAS